MAHGQGAMGRAPQGLLFCIGPSLYSSATALKDCGADALPDMLLLLPSLLRTPNVMQPSSLHDVHVSSINWQQC
jgi:hypothetical protein